MILTLIRLLHKFYFIFFKKFTSQWQSVIIQTFLHNLLSTVSMHMAEPQSTDQFYNLTPVVY